MNLRAKNTAIQKSSVEEPIKTFFSQSLNDVLERFESIKAIVICTEIRSVFGGRVNPSQFSEFIRGKKDLRASSIQQILLAIARINPSALDLYLDNLKKYILEEVENKRNILELQKSVEKRPRTNSIYLAFLLARQMEEKKLSELDVAKGMDVPAERIDLILSGLATEKEIKSCIKFLITQGLTEESIKILNVY